MHFYQAVKGLFLSFIFGTVLLSCQSESPKVTKDKNKPPQVTNSLRLDSKIPDSQIQDQISCRIIVTPGKTVSGVPDEARVQEITKHLSPHLQGVGKPIGDRAAWAKAFPDQDMILSSAERESKERTPELTDELYLLFTQKGSRIEFDEPYQRRTKRLNHFVIAECVENKGRFLPAIEGELAAILGEKNWTQSAHDPKLDAFNEKMIIDLGSSIRACNVAIADYLLGEKLQSSTREKIRAEVQRRVLQPYKDAILGKYTLGQNKWWITATNNWNPSCHSSVIAAALCLLDDPSDRAWYIAAAELHIGNYLAGFTSDGYCNEGIGYWNGGFGHYVLMAEMIGEATKWKVNFYQPSIVKSIFTFPKRLELTPNVYPAYADCPPNFRPSPWIFQLAGQHIVADIPIPSGRPTLKITEAYFMPEPIVNAFAKFYEKEKSVTSQGGYALRDSFQDAGVITCRTPMVNGKGFAMSLLAGHNNEHHNHNDVGSFVVAMNDKALIIDPGMEVYTKRTFSPQRYESKMLNSYGHSVPVLAGKLQDTGAEARGTIKTIQTTNEKDEYVVDLSKAYAKSVPSLKKMDRHVIFIRVPKPRLEIIDEVEFDTPQTFGNALITFDQHRVITPNSLVIYNGEEAFQVTIDSEGKSFDIKDEIFDEKLYTKQKVKRIGFTLQETVSKACFKYIIEPAASPVSNSPLLEKMKAEESRPKFSEAITKEAEKLHDEYGGTVKIASKLGATGGACVNMWDSPGHELTWKFQVQKAGIYGVLVRYCRGMSGEGKRDLKIDGKTVGGIQGSFAFGDTGGWSSEQDNWREVWFAQSGRVYRLSLSAGEHLVSIKNIEGGGTNLDWVALVPLENP